MKNIIITLSFLLLISCNGDKSIFKGDINIVNKPDSEIIKGNRIELDGVYTGSMCAYDSLLSFYSSSFSDYCGIVFNVKTGKQMSHIVKKGNGPTEFQSITYSQQYDKKENICMWFYDWTKTKCILIDLKTGLWEDHVDISGLNKNHHAFSRTFILNDSLILANNQGYEIRPAHLEPPVYHIYNYKTKKKINEFSIYNGFNFSGQLTPQDYLFSYDRIKPDKSKVVMAMENIQQINILDIATGKTSGYRVKGSPDLSILKSSKNIIPYYADIWVDDSLIYGIVKNKDLTININVFDWAGNFKKVLQLNENALIFSFDPVNKVLYTKNDMEEIYAYNVKYLYEK